MKHRIVFSSLVTSVLILSLFLPLRALASSPLIEFEQHLISDHIPNSRTVFVTDLDKDGDNDLLGSDRQNNKLYLYLNDGSQNFAESVVDNIDAYWIEAGDIDQDGDVDLAVVGFAIYGYEGYWYENQGNMIFVRHRIAHWGLDPSYIQILDMDYDGDFDFVANANGWYRAHIFWYENDGGENFVQHEILDLYSPQNSGCQTSVPADMDLDGDFDLVQACDSSPVFWLVNDGNQNFARYDISRIFSFSPYNIQAVDMDHDGDVDVLVPDINDGTFWLENDGFQHYVEHRISSNRLVVTTVWAMDIDHDGDMDVVEADHGFNQVLLWSNQGDMTFTAQTVADNLGGVLSVFVFDLDRDNDEDIIIDEFSVGRLSWFEQTPVYQPPTISGANINIYNIIEGIGDGSSPDTYYRFEVFMRAQGDFSALDAAKVTLSVDDIPLNIGHAGISYDGEQYNINAGGQFGGIPPFGEYTITLEDANGQRSDPFVIGNLDDYPKDAPDILFPQHQSSITDRQPTFSWEAFSSSYLGQPIAPWAYEMDLGFPNGERYFAFPIAGDQTSMNYRTPLWDSSQPPDLERGLYDLTIHSNHQVAPGFNFEHHRTIHFEIVPPNLSPTANAGPDQAVFEGDLVALDASASFDLDGNIARYEWDLDSDGEYDDAIGATSELSFPDNDSHIVGLRVTDEFGVLDTDTVEIIVSNIAPIINILTAPFDPAQVGINIQTAATFSDPGTADTHTAVWDWGDGSTSDGLVEDYSITGSHAYNASGVYTVTLTVTDDDGGVDTAIFQYVVIYDPNGGFVTGGGWINSPVGAYIPDPALSGKATFGFVSKYQKGTNIPTGDTEFQFHVAGMNFKSTTYDWLVIAGAKAQYKGIGTINGAGAYRFMLTAMDGSPDKFRIKIWDEATGEVIYDNQLNSEDTAAPTTVIEGGSIVIHKAK